MKNLLMDFLNFVLFLIIISLCIVYFIVGDRLDTFTEMLKSLIPVGIFGLLFLVKLIKSRKDNKVKEEEGNIDIVIYLTTKDKFVNDIIIFSIPIIILLIAFFGDQINKIDIFQALVAFLMIFGWSAYIFKNK
jgi:hypothetical protein